LLREQSGAIKKFKMASAKQPTTRAICGEPKGSALWALGIVIVLFVSSGANCNQWIRSYTQPRTLPDAATLDQIVTTVNGNTAKVQSLQATQATLSLPGAPSLRANLALQTPRRLRLQANGPLGGGPELDLGSNDELFWLWVRRNQPPAMFICRHDQFAMSNARQIIPVEPEWLLEAVGLARIDSTQLIDGPTPIGNQRVQVRSRQPSMLGDLTKVTVIDGWDGTVLEQHLYDVQGQRLASAITGRYKRDPVSGAALPRSIEIQWPTAQMSFHVDVNDWLVNTIAPDNMALWTKPIYQGYPEVDLADPHLQFSVPTAAPAAGGIPVGTLMPLNTTMAPR
jgi:hypothetical protein